MLLQSLMGAIASVLPDAAERFCVKHIAVYAAVTGFGQAIRLHIWSCACADTPADYVVTLDAIESAPKP